MVYSRVRAQGPKSVMVYGDSKSKEILSFVIDVYRLLNLVRQELPFEPKSFMAKVEVYNNTSTAFRMRDVTTNGEETLQSGSATPRDTTCTYVSNIFPLTNKVKIYEQILTNELIGQLFAKTALYSKRVALKECKELVKSLYPEYGEAVIDRRTKCMIGWCEEIMDYLKTQRKI